MNILLSHPDFIVVDKASGVTMHDANEGIVSQVEKANSLSGLHLAHRLDDGTSGCLILAKHSDAAAHFEFLFRTRKIHKYYLACSAKKPKKKQGMVVGDMKNRRNGQYILTKTTNQPAITQFKSVGFENSPRVFIIRPLSGKTHQIRVALKSLGSPIIGDTLYGGESSDRLYLHAWGLEFNWHGSPISVYCPPQQGVFFTRQTFQQWLQIQSSPSQLTWPTLPSALTSTVYAGKR